MSLSPETEIDVVMYKTIQYGDLEMMRKNAEAKGWKVKFSEKNYLKQGNGF